MADDDVFPCAVSKGTKLEVYIGRRDEDVLIEVAISDVLRGDSSVCLDFEAARKVAAQLVDLADRVERHLAKSES